MRAETLAEAEVIGFLQKHFVLAWSNLLPELFGAADPNADPPKYPVEQTRDLPEGAGGGNIRIYFCTADGKIVHQVLGLWRIQRFLDECRFALSLPTADPAEMTKLQKQHRQKLEGEWARAHELIKPGSNWRDPSVRKAGTCGIRLRSADELFKDLLADVEAVIDRRREEVFTKGALGCDS
jgi:hypothetical protein